MSIQAENRLNGLSAQERVRKILGIEPRFRGQRGNEETWPESPFMPGIRWEVKLTKRMPALLRNALAQVQVTRAVGSTFDAAVAIVDADTDRAYALVPLEPLVELCKALAEMGQGSKVRSLVRDAEKILHEIKETAR